MTPISTSDIALVKNFAESITSALSEIWGMEIDQVIEFVSPEAEQLRAEELTGSLLGGFWLVEVETAGAYVGKFAILIDSKIVGSLSFGAIIDLTLNAASAKFSKDAHGVVAAERASLREVSGERAVELLKTMFGNDELVIASSTAKIADQKGEIAIFVSKELTGIICGHISKAEIKKQTPKPEPKDDALQERAKNISIKLNVEIGHRKMTVAELLELHVGASLSLEQDCISPLSLMAGNREIAKGDVVTMGGRFGLRVRASN